ncbi:MAG: hypothetical protein RBT78_02395 [Kiritimatiellia bacterium]|jgi:hypothetical protein|nr:hypothetical protein [Kiritimatiellia bacterium]
MKRWMTVMALTATIGSAQDVSWNAADGDLAVPSNWSGGVLPGVTNTVVFSQQGAFTLTTSAWLTNAAALFNAGANGSAVTLDLSGYGLQLTNALTFKRTSGTGSNVLALTGGTLFTEKKVLIGDGNAYHTLRVNGAGTRWVCATNREGFFVNGNSNRLEITGGASFYSGGYSSLNGIDARGVISGQGTYAEFVNPQVSQHQNDAVFTLAGNDGAELRVTDQAVLYVKALNSTSKGFCVNNWWNQPGSKRLILDGGATITNLGVFAVDAGIEGQGSNNGNSAVVSNATLYVNGPTWVGYGWQPSWTGSKVGGNSNTLSIGDGAAVRLGGGDTYVGFNQMSSYNLVDVCGTAFVTNTSSLRLGNFGSNNRMVIRDGAQYYGWIGAGVTTTATNNLLTITGAGTRYMCVTYTDRHVNDAYLVAGSAGSFNKVLIDDGVRVDLLFNATTSERRGLVTGVYSNSYGNELVIRGKSFVTNMGWLCIGNTHRDWGGGSGNRVVIDDATYLGQTVYVGGGNNSVAVKSLGASTNNALTVSGGAQVSVSSLLFGNATNSCSNRLVLDGPATYLYAGGLYGNSADNTLSITNATFEAGWINFGGYGNGYNARTRIEFSGTNSCLRTVAQSIIITNGTTLVFNVGKEGYARTPFASLYDLRVDDTTGLEINAAQWARRTGGRIVLVETGRTAQGSFADWAARAAKDSGEFTVSAESGKIVLTSPRKGGTMVSVR